MVDLASLQHKDSMIRQSNLGEFLSSLQKNTIPLADLNSEDKYELISILVENIKNSNPRLSLPSLECIQALSDTCLGGEINILNKSIISVCREKLSDTHDNVRQSACNLLLTMMSPTLGVGAQEVLLQLMEPTLKHKSPKVREEGLKLIKTSLNMYPKELKISRFIQQIFAMLTDPTAPVRSAANDLVITSYLKFGDRIKTDLLKSQIPDDKVKKLIKDFQNLDSQTSPGQFRDIPDSYERSPEDNALFKPMISIEGQPLSYVENISNSSVDSEEGSAKSMPILSKLPTNQKRAGGGLTVDDFERAFDEVDEIYINTESDLEKQIFKLISGLGVDSEEWEKRVNTLKDVQATVRTCSNRFPTFPHHLRKLDSSLNDCLRDLRSQVAREACITLAYTSKLNGKAMEKSLEYLITPLLTVIQNSTKIINSSADICLQYCLLNTQTSKVVPLICRQMESKAAVVKKRCAEYLLIMLQNWPVSLLKQHESAISESIKKGLSDGDPSCREFSRTSFPYFNRHFPSSGNKLLSSLSSALQKTIRDLTPETELTQNVGSLLKARSAIPRPGSRPNSRQGAPGLGLRSAVSESNLRETEPRSQSREDAKPPKHKLELPSRAMTLSGPKPKIRTSLGGIRSSSAMSVDKDEDEPGRLDPNRNRPISGGSMRIKKSSNTSVIPPSEGTPVNQRKIQSLVKQKVRTKESNPETGYTGVDKKSSVDTQASRRSQSADFLSRTKNSQNSTSPEFIPLERLNLPDLVKQIKKQQFADKKAGIEGLHQLVNSVEYTLSLEEVQLFKDSLRWLFPESHAKLFIMFLDLLISFIQVYKSYAEQWAHFIIMKLLHRLGTETMSTVKDKMTKVLDVIMLNFQKDRIFLCLWRILIDTTQPLSLKGKQAYCDFLKTITNHADGPDFNVSQESTKAFESLVRMAHDPKPELSRYSKATLQALFQLNCATFSTLSDTMPRGDRELLTSLMRDATESPPNEQEEFSPNSNVALDQLLRGYGADIDRRISEPFLTIPLKLKPAETDQLQRDTRRICLTPVLGGKKYDSMKTTRGITKFNRGATSPLDSRQKFGGIRSEPASPTDDTLLPSFSLPPASQIRGFLLKESTVESSTLEPYPYDESPVRNPIQSAIREYQMCETIDDKVSNLILILTIIQTTQDERAWTDQMDVILNIAMEAMRQFEYPTITITSLRIIREFLKRRLVKIKEHTKELVQFLVDTYPNPKSDIARSCEEIMNHIAGNIDPDVTFEMLAPTIAIEQNESLLCAIGKHKILHKIVPDTSHAILNAHLATFCPTLIQNYKHADPTVRKASCFVLVVLYRKLGMSVYEYFKELTSAQMKLLSLYMSRSTDEMK